MKNKCVSIIIAFAVTIITIATITVRNSIIKEHDWKVDHVDLKNDNKENNGVRNYDSMRNELEQKSEKYKDAFRNAANDYRMLY